MGLVNKLKKMSDTKRFLFAIGVGTYALAISEYLSAPRLHSGKFSWLINRLIESFGPYGAVYFWILLGSFLIYLALTSDKKDF